MKYIKTFENVIDEPPKFKKGDIVYIVNVDNQDHLYTHLKKDTPYIIDNVEFGIKTYLVSIKNNTGTSTFYSQNRFISELEYNSKKFNL